MQVLPQGAPVILRDRRTSPLAVLAAAVLAACSTPRTTTGSEVPACQVCHGTTGQNAAPPRAVNGDVSTAALGVGAHQAHLADSEFRKAIECSECHVVPTSSAHANGAVDLTWGTLATADGAAPAVAVAGGTATCSGVYCHGATLGAGGSYTRPTWNSATSVTLSCGSCHGNPPPAPHTSSASCNACHPLTVQADGAIDLAGGHHVNGVVEASASHPDFTSPAVHGPRFFEFLAGAPDALDCTSCHGATYDGGTGPSCNACHTSAGWTGWSTNCSFCHGTRSASTKAGYDVALRPEWSAPPDALAQRLDPAQAPVPARTGAHQPHLTGKGSSTGQVYAAPFPCATCHTVPTDVAHAGGPGRAPVVLKGSGTLPADLGSYAPATGSCTTYCHGTTLADDAGLVSPPPAWTGGELGCAGCHGNPPASGEHAFHVTGQRYTCTVCHSTTVPSAGAIGAAHLDGTRNVAFVGSGLATWDGTSCAAICHASPAVLRPWR
jgi:predicted CxxxxCH...CXXCH cytochrome family protein